MFNLILKLPFFRQDKEIGNHDVVARYEQSLRAAQQITFTEAVPLGIKGELRDIALPDNRRIKRDYVFFRPPNTEVIASITLAVLEHGKIVEASQLDVGKVSSTLNGALDIYDL